MQKKISFKKFFQKKIFSKKIFEKSFMFGKNISFCKIFENYFSENEIFENWSMAVRIWSFFGQLQWPITRICITQTKHLIPLIDSTHQGLWSDNQREKNLKSDLGDIAILKNYQSYPYWHESIFEDSIFWKIIFKNQFFSKNFKKRCRKISKENFQKNLQNIFR